MKAMKCINNPLILPMDITPSHPEFKVDGVFNCGVAEYNGQILLLCRVAESVRTKSEEELCIPVISWENDAEQIELITLNKNVHSELDFSDMRFVSENGRVRYLTSLSHLRIARSRDGIHFEMDERPAIWPGCAEESWGIEDPRITKMEDTFYINYTAVSENGAATALISTKDFITYTRHGIIFAPENKDIVIFPEQIDGKYLAFTRPVPAGIGEPEMWMAKSPDLIHWGEHKYFGGMSKNNPDSWENGRTGGGAIPIKTERGWVMIYHAADRRARYCLGAYLLGLNDPSVVLAKTSAPILEPEESYEADGFFGNVVFTCGCMLKEDTVIIYYGAADDKICRADIRLQDIFESMK